MTDIVYIRDKRGAVPNYVIVDNDDGNAIVLNQFTRETELIGPRPYSTEQLRAAMHRITGREIEWLTSQRKKR